MRQPSRFCLTCRRKIWSYSGRCPTCYGTPEPTTPPVYHVPGQSKRRLFCYFCGLDTPVGVGICYVCASIPHVRLFGIPEQLDPDTLDATDPPTAIDAYHGHEPDA